MISGNDLEREYRIVVRDIPRSKASKWVSNYQERVREAAKREITNPLAGSVSIRVLYFHTARNPVDVDNLLKAILDGLGGAAYQDDSQVDHVEVTRFNISRGPVKIDYGWLVDDVGSAIAQQQPFVAIVVRSRAVEEGR